jgi:hypothetical protein
VSCFVTPETLWAIETAGIDLPTFAHDVLKAELAAAACA